ncbi:helix-turn-helix transcriptional regulator [Hymenobacter sp. BRD128]|uniref:winged helix-turn-helix transcriptional regulator n=1 Tax=Hymenobacter sp. BRD128 TaxID=2675878 RepID=UPI001566F68E|nr:helix-turn-helix domain-containing protein [Hymenobacter sp. BRD128]QKG58331.1 helix-turn-helix transcriptional regulator [Hymenobacter sp. BRD128]
MENKVAQLYGCAIGASVSMVGGKWKTSILLHLRDQTLRFGALQRLVGCSQKVLTQQLKELEQDGIVQRQVYAEVPPRVEYCLSTYGRTLQPVLDALYAWGRTHYLRSQQAEVPATAAV